MNAPTHQTVIDVIDIPMFTEYAYFTQRILIYAQLIVRDIKKVTSFFSVSLKSVSELSEKGSIIMASDMNRISS